MYDPYALEPDPNVTTSDQTSLPQSGLLKDAVKEDGDYYVNLDSGEVWQWEESEWKNTGLLVQDWMPLGSLKMILGLK